MNDVQNEAVVRSRNKSGRGLTALQDLADIGVARYSRSVLECGQPSAALAFISPATVVLSIVFLAALSSQSLAATDEGNQVVIIYNSRMPGSQAVAEHYAEKRMVPANHIFGFALTTNEDISRGDFRDELQRPLSKALEK